jgi:hypothetical protein
MVPHPHPTAFAAFSVAFFQYILEDFGYRIALPQALGMDNQSAFRVVKNPEHQGRIKHLNPIYYGFREQVEAGELSPLYVKMLGLQV